MRSWLVIPAGVVSISLAFSAVCGGQTPSQASTAQTSTGPLTAAINRSIDRLVATSPTPDDGAAAGDGTKQSAGSDWADVRALTAGREIVLLTSTGIDGRRTFVFADDAELVVLQLSHPALPRSVRKRLREISVDQPTALLAARQRTIVSDRTISVGAGVISESGRTLVALDEVLQTIPRSSVREIRIERTRGSRLGAVAGATAGIVAGILTAPYWMMKQCGGSCGDEQFMLGVSLVGFPVAGALVGYLPRAEELIVYQSRGLSR